MNFFSLQALAKKIKFFSRGLQMVSRTCIFTVLNEVNFSLADI